MDSITGLRFELYPLRFSFLAVDSIHFPAGKSANILRGAFGTILRRLVCVPECTDARTCPARVNCPYARIFEPSAGVPGPSGFQDWPRPFVFRAMHLDGVTIRPGSAFHFDLNLFDTRNPVIPYLVAAFGELAEQGLGPGRGRARLTDVSQLDENLVAMQAGVPLVLHLEPIAGTLRRIAVRFVTPAELKSGNEIVSRPEFGVLAARVSDRISKLSELYGAGPLAIDHKGFRERAARVSLVSAQLENAAVERRSSKTGQVHSLGGFTGNAVYEGELAEFLPWLKAAQWTGVGRQTAFGKGELHVG